MSAFRESFKRIVVATAIAVPTWLAISALLFILPNPCAIGALLIGLAALKFGAEFGRRWVTILGGILMFSGLFAWALKQ